MRALAPVGCRSHSAEPAPRGGVSWKAQHAFVAVPETARGRGGFREVWFSVQLVCEAPPPSVREAEAEKCRGGVGFALGPPRGSLGPGGGLLRPGIWRALAVQFP